MAAEGEISGVVIQALRYLGKTHVMMKHLDHLKRTLTDDQKKQLKNNISRVPVWIARHLAEIAAKAA